MIKFKDRFKNPSSANANILHGTPTANNDEKEDNDIEEVDMPQTSQHNLSMLMQGAMGTKRKEEQDENPVDTLSQNQDNAPNTTAMPVITAVDDQTTGDKPNGTVEMEDVEEDDDGDDASDSKDDNDSTKGVDNRYPRRNRKNIDTYEP